MGEMFCCRLTGLVQNITQVDILSVLWIFFFVCLFSSHCYESKKRMDLYERFPTIPPCTARVYIAIGATGDQLIGKSLTNPKDGGLTFVDF